MTAVFVHGVPETYRIWDAIRSECGQYSVALALPGFDAPVPPNWVANKESYADWIIAEIERLDGPVDIVGHDWGCLLTQRVVSVRPDLFRSWACGGGPVDTEYVWHDTAQAWQTPELGEQVMAMMTPEMLATALVGELGEHAAPMASFVDETMKQCILGLYRSAIDVGTEWQSAVDELGDRLPAMVIWGRDDVYAQPEMGQRLATRVGARLSVLDCGHFWPVLRSAEVAALLRDFWASLP